MPPNSPRPLVVAIDGPSGSGKSSVARGVAARLGLRFVDTGAMYRALTWWALSRGVDLADTDRVAALARELPLQLGTDPEDPHVLVDGNDVGEAIRTPRDLGSGQRRGDQPRRARGARPPPARPRRGGRGRGRGP